ncbi:DUF4922 domain-containing protein [Bacteroidota bacterium]
MSISQQARQLIQDQITEWPLAGRNYDGMENIRTRSLHYDGFELFIQHNPERIRSSAAKVDAKSIEARPCFLCQNNLPPEQKGIPVLDDYLILVNPYPIFPEHLTIPHQKHIDQKIEGKFTDMLELAVKLDDFVVFYNGPKCGASAPDHFHFQAGIKRFMPIENDFNKGNKHEIIKEQNGVKIFRWHNYLRNTISFKGNDIVTINLLFERIYARLLEFQPDEEEPMLNILSYYDCSEWTIHIFPRNLHRPSQYFEKGEKQIILSPASVDLGGVLITPREEDFNKLTKSNVESIFKQVCLSGKPIEELYKSLL